MNNIYFDSPEEALDKLKDIKLLSKSSKISNLDNIVYKQISDDGIPISYPCNVLGFSYKHTKEKCLGDIYENLIVTANQKTFNINIEYLISMQKKGFGLQKTDE